MDIRIEHTYNSETTASTNKLISEYIQFNYNKMKRKSNELILGIVISIVFVIIGKYFDFSFLRFNYVFYILITVMFGINYYRIYRLKSENETLHKEIIESANINYTSISINDIGIDCKDNLGEINYKWNQFKNYDTFESLIIFFPKKIKNKLIIIDCSDIEDSQMSEFHSYVESGLKIKI